MAYCVRRMRDGASVKGPLDATERISEALFGLIMVLTFTCSISVAESGRDDVKTMLVGAIGCNLAWAIIDAAFYLMDCVSERGRNLRALRSVQEAASAEAGQRAIADVLPPLIAQNLRAEELERLRQKLLTETLPARPRLEGRDWLGALGVFLWVFVVTIPVAIPFVVTHEVQLALRSSNAIAIVLLLVAGHAYGRSAGLRPWVCGFGMVLLGGGFVALTIALGG